MKMKELFDRGEFAVSAEVGPSKGIHVDELVEEAKTYLTGVHAVNVTDNQSSVMRLGSLAMCKVLKDAGMNPSLHAVTETVSLWSLIFSAQLCSVLTIFSALLVTIPRWVIIHRQNRSSTLIPYPFFTQ